MSSLENAENGGNEQPRSPPAATKATGKTSTYLEPIVIIDDEYEDDAEPNKITRSIPTAPHSRGALSSCLSRKKDSIKLHETTEPTLLGRPKSSFNTNGYRSPYFALPNPQPAKRPLSTILPDEQLTTASPPTKKALLSSESPQDSRTRKTPQPTNHKNKSPTLLNRRSSTTTNTSARSQNKRALQSLQSTLTSRIANYTSLLDHSDQGSRASKIADVRVEDQTSSSVAEEIARISTSIIPVAGNEANVDRTATDHKSTCTIDVGEVLLAIEAWEACEQRKLLVRKRLVAEGVKDVVDDWLTE